MFGKTTYTYATGPTAADANALTSLTFADGTGIEWSYDAQGRLATTGRLNGSGPEAEVETYAYPAPANTRSPTPTATRRPPSTTTRATSARRSTPWATSRATLTMPTTT